MRAHEDRSYQASRIWPFAIKTLRYTSDLTDAEWALVRPLIPAAAGRDSRGAVDLREIVNGVLYVICLDCSRTSLPEDLPPFSTISEHFECWDSDGTLDRICRALITSHYQKGRTKT